MAKCFECNETAHHNHHVVPKSLGGTNTVPLCRSCHETIHQGKVVKKNPLNHRELIRAHQAQGKHWGQTPYGYTKVDGYLVKVREQQVVVRYMRYLRYLGVSCGGIGERLVERGILGRRGKVWCAQGVRSVLLGVGKWGQWEWPGEAEGKK